MKKYPVKDFENSVEEHYVGLPAYNNVKQDGPLITATFKFLTEEDYEEFKVLIKKHIYDGHKMFDGNQTKTKKSAWYPLKEKASKYVYIDKKYPVPWS